MLESLLIGLIVITASVYAAWALTPAATRNRMASWLASAIERRKPRGMAAWVAAKLRAVARTSAGGCSNCPSHAATPAERASKQARGG